MEIIVTCDECRARYRAPMTFAGRQAICRVCGHVVAIPLPEGAGNGEKPAANRNEASSTQRLAFRIPNAEGRQEPPERDTQDRRMAMRNEEVRDAAGHQEVAPERDDQDRKIEMRTAVEHEAEGLKEAAPERKAEAREAVCDPQAPASGNWEAGSETWEAGIEPREAGGWYVSIPGVEKKQGPFTSEEIRIGLRHGSFAPEHLAWRAGMKSGKALGEIAELAAEDGAASPAEISGALPAPRKKAWPRRWAAVAAGAVMMIVLVGWLSGAPKKLNVAFDSKQRTVQELMRSIIYGDMAAVEKIADGRNQKNVVRDARTHSRNVEEYQKIEYVKEFSEANIKTEEEITGRVYRVDLRKKYKGLIVPGSVYVVVTHDTEKIYNLANRLEDVGRRKK